MNASQTKLWTLDEFFPDPFPTTPNERKGNEPQLIISGSGSSPISWPPQLDNTHSRYNQSSGSAASDTPALPLFSFDVDPIPIAELEEITSVDGRSSDDISVEFLDSCSSTPVGAINKLINSKLFQALVEPAIPYGAPAVIEVDSVGSSAAHQYNVWKFICTTKFLDGARGTRQSAFVCNNPLVSRCDRVMTESGSMRNHQTTQGHGKANIVCMECQLVFNTGRNSAFKRHKEKARANRQKKMSEAATDRVKKTRKPKKERKPAV
ncbi:hypothetical protein BJ912DRAFT_1062330 [Pholiota molesta]|nr:hypothetical protein BJ912DRAFT_1062330 [Pholiota molesta]